MDSISKLNNAILSIPNELSVAAANFNLDFSLMKVEAPKEFHGVRDALSNYRRDEAEEGQPHITARRLGALFESILPSTPNLIQAYGTRASSISSQSGQKAQNEHNTGLFAKQAGIDGTSLWAAATSGSGALAIHLLACMLARIWKSHEAISLWVELVERRKQEISDTYHNGSATETAAIMASRQTFSRQHLASWDSSARSWLQTADVSRRFQQTQLMLIINNVRVPVNAMKDPYKSVVKAWTSAMSAMELLVQGIPQQVQDGAILLAISSWHLYPNMEVLVQETKSVDMNDELVNGGLLTISAQGMGSSKEGVFWSLPLSRMRFYSPPVVAERHISSETSRVTMAELWIVVLGIIVSQWHAACADTERCCKFIIALSAHVNKPYVTILWLKYLADAAVQYTSSKAEGRPQVERLFKLGKRRCQSFLNQPEQDLPPFFGLALFPVLLSAIPRVEDKIRIMRRIAQSLQADAQDLIIQCKGRIGSSPHYPYGRPVYFLATALPWLSTPRGEDEPMAKRQCRELVPGHCRWVVNDFDPPETSCNGDDCSCVFQTGPSCACAESGHSCSFSCHKDLVTLSRCASESNSQPRGQCYNKVFSSEGDLAFLEECPKDRQERVVISEDCPEDCERCYLRSYVSRLESSGEHCCFLRKHDVRHLDEWHFMLESPMEDTIYDFLLGYRDGISLFKRNDSRVARYLPTRAGSPATLSEIEDILADRSVDIRAIGSHLTGWWTTASAACAQQGLSMAALQFASELFKSLEGSTISIEVVQIPLYEAAWAISAVTHYQFGDIEVQMDGIRSPPQATEYSQATSPPSDRACSLLNSKACDDTPLEVPFTEQADNGLAHTKSASSMATGSLSQQHNRPINHTMVPDTSGVNKMSPQESHTDSGSPGMEANLVRIHGRHSALPVSFACIAMFETGELNVDPKSLNGVMALSRGDSIYVASDLVSDPSEDTRKNPVRRVFGNLGRPEMVFLIPPSRPKLKDYELTSWHLINHNPFDGKFRDSFSSTSLHLSFTDYEMPLDVGVRGLRDTLVVLVESLVSINDRGTYLGDLDIISMLGSKFLTLMEKCTHHSECPSIQGGLENLISIDSWAEFFDLPETTGIVRANRNWQARLAIASASLQRGKRTLVLPPNPCLQCIETVCKHGPPGFDVIVA